MFGITENGDASLNYEWLNKINDMDGAVLITKKLTSTFKRIVLDYKDLYKFIIHVSCTGYGGTVLEPRLEKYQDTIDGIRTLIDNKFPANRIVLRIDPVIPTDRGVKTFEDVVRYAAKVIPEVKRIRISVIDMYPHIRKRFEKAKLPCPYGSNIFQASDEMFNSLNTAIIRLKNEFPGIRFESCAETKLPATDMIGCISKNDFEILDIPYSCESKKGQRKNCLCIGDKKDMLTYLYNRTGYNHCYGCLYCYWKTELDK